MMDADLTPGANLSGAYLDGAMLAYSNLTGADLTGVQTCPVSSVLTLVVPWTFHLNIGKVRNHRAPTPQSRSKLEEAPYSDVSDHSLRRSGGAWGCTAFPLVMHPS